MWIGKRICRPLSASGKRRPVPESCNRQSTGSKSSILICDEATSALDVTVQKQIMELLQKLKKENQLSFLFICHDLALVQLFCDRVIVMHDGHVEEEGTPEEIIEHPKTEYTEQLIRSVL